MEIQIDPELRSLITPLCDDEYRMLEQSLLAEGCRDAIIVWKNGGRAPSIVDGHNRYEICQKHNLPFRITEKNFNSKEEAEIWILTNQLGRRNLTDDQRAVITDELIQRQGKVNLQKTAENARKSKNVSLDAVCQTKDKTNTRLELSQKARVSERKVRKARKLRNNSPELAAKVRQGEMTLMEAERKMKGDMREKKREENRKVIETNPQPLPGQRFKTIVIDPPWDWGDEGDIDQMGRAKPTYQTMPFEQLMELPVAELAENNAHIYLWITNRSLPKGFALLEKWGFRYVTAITWGKPSYGMGNYFRGQTEHILFGVKGSLPLLRNDAGTLILAGRGDKHSAKPEEVYRLIETCSPGQWLEMFARESRAGWVSWGGELA